MGLAFCIFLWFSLDCIVLAFDVFGLVSSVLLSLTYKVITTTQPPYLHNPISFNLLATLAPHTLARPPTSSSLRITDRSFRYASPGLWNELPSSLRQPHSSPSVSDLPVHAPATSSYSLSLSLSPSITPSVFHSWLKTYLFHKSFPPYTPFWPQD